MSAYVVTGLAAWVLIGFMFVGWLVVSCALIATMSRRVDRLIERRLDAYRQRLEQP